MIYFIRSGDFVKIGYSIDPWGRMASLQTAHHQPLEMLAVMPGEKTDEREIHRRFRNYRERGEWFRESWPLGQFINEARRVNPEMQEQPEPKDTPTEERGTIPPIKFNQMYYAEEIDKACSLFNVFVQSGGLVKYNENDEVFLLEVPDVHWVGGDDPTMRYVVDYDSGQATVRIGREIKLRTLTDRINEVMMHVEYFFHPQVIYREGYGIHIVFRKIAAGTIIETGAPSSDGVPFTAVQSTG